MNSGAIMNRINFGLRLAAGQIPGARVAAWPSAARLRKLPMDAQVNGVIEEILGGDASSETRQALMTGENPILKGAHAPGQERTASALGSASDRWLGTRLSRISTTINRGQSPVSLKSRCI